MDRCAKVNGKIHLEFIYNQKGLLKLALLIEISVGKILLAPSLNISDGIVSPEQHSKPHSKPSHLPLASSTRVPSASVVCWLGSREEYYQPELERAFQTTRVLFQYCEGFLELQVRNTEQSTSCLISCKQILNPSDSSIQDYFVWLNENCKARKENYQSTGGQAREGRSQVGGSSHKSGKVRHSCGCGWNPARHGSLLTLLNRQLSLADA